MADQRITQLNELSGAGVAANDVLAIVDISGSETKKVTVQNLVGTTFTLAASGAIDLIKLNQASATKLGTAAIADDAITYTKIQNVTATDRLLGRQTAGAGAVEEIICTAAGRALLDDTNAAAQRTTLELGTGNSVVFSSVTANITAASATISGGTITGITDLAVADGGTGASTAANARTNLGVAIGTDIQAYDAGLQSIANLLTQADRGIYTTASDTYATFVFTAAGRALLDDADAAAQRTTLGLGALATLDEITSAQITNLTISSVDIADAAVTSAKLSLNAGDLAGTLIANGGIGTTQLANTAVTNDKITDGTISFVKLNLNAGDIPGDRIATGGIGTTQIANDAVVSTKIADNTVSYAKIQDVTSTDRLLGRSSVGAGDIEEIVCTSSGRALLVGASAAAQRLTLGLGSIATLDAITSAEITDLTVNTADLAENSVTIAKLNLNAGELAGNLIANSGITATQLGTSAVETAKIQDRAVTYTKIQNTTTDDIIIGRVSAGAGGLEEITCTAVGRALIDDVTVADQRAMPHSDGAFSWQLPPAFLESRCHSLSFAHFRSQSGFAHRQPRHRCALPEAESAGGAAHGIHAHRWRGLHIGALHEQHTPHSLSKRGHRRLHGNGGRNAGPATDVHGCRQRCPQSHSGEYHRISEWGHRNSAYRWRRHTHR